MRIDGLIFDKKYISKLEFDGDILTLFRKGDCHPFKYKMYSEKTKAQIAKLYNFFSPFVIRALTFFFFFILSLFYSFN